MVQTYYKNIKQLNFNKQNVLQINKNSLTL